MFVHKKGPIDFSGLSGLGWQRSNFAFCKPFSRLLDCTQMVQVVKTAGIYRQVKIDSSIYNVVSAGTFLSWLPLRDKSLVFVKEMICLANSHGEIWGGHDGGDRHAPLTERVCV